MKEQSHSPVKHIAILNGASIVFFYHHRKNVISIDQAKVGKKKEIKVLRSSGLYLLVCGI